jgi:hypothetical protein
MGVRHSRRSKLPRPSSLDETVEAIQNPASELKTYYAMLAIALLMILVPIWTVDYPGIVDYPNHLVRCYILAHYHDNPLWQQRFRLDYSPLPNLAIDLIVTPLLRIMPLLRAGKVFLSLAATLYVVGCSETGRALTGKPNWLAIVCAFTFYNSPFLFGFVNYVFGIGVFLCVFAFWLRVRDAMTPLRFFVCCFLSIVAFLAHLSSVVILGVACLTIALLDFARDRRISRLIVKLVWLACPLVFMAGFLKSSGPVGVIAWASPREKLISLLAPVRSYSVALDFAVILVLFVCALAMQARSRVHGGAWAGFVLFALFLITPSALYTVSAADARYVIPAYLILALSIELRQGRWQKAALALASAAMVIHTASIAANWLTINHRSQQVLAMGDGLPVGARIYVLKPALDVTKLDRGFVHVIQYWTISHGADLSTLFAIPGQQPLVFREPPCGGPEWVKCLAGYDYVWTYDPTASVRQALPGLAEPAATWEKVTLWRLNHAPSLQAARPLQ